MLFGVSCIVYCGRSLSRRCVDSTGSGCGGAHALRGAHARGVQEENKLKRRGRQSVIRGIGRGGGGGGGALAVRTRRHVGCAVNEETRFVLTGSSFVSADPQSALIISKMAALSL